MKYTCVHVASWNYAAARDLDFLIEFIRNVGVDTRKWEMFQIWTVDSALEERTEKEYLEFKGSQIALFF